MEGFGRSGVLWWLTVVVAVIGAACQPPPQLIKVGGAAGWTKDFNYTKWAIHQRFYVGYWLIFNFDKHYYNVLEVNKANYEQCNDQNFITNITKGGRDVFNLTQARPYYFLSSGGYCYQGMKLAINVEEYEAPAPAPAKNGCSVSTRTGVLLVVLLEITLLWSLLLKLY